MIFYSVQDGGKKCFYLMRIQTKKEERKVATKKTELCTKFDYVLSKKEGRIEELQKRTFMKLDFFF